MSTLANIRTKVRRLTRSPSVNQLDDVTLDRYINDFVQYDFPEHLRLFTLRQTLTFYTSPFVDVYATNAIAGDPLNNFENAIINVHQPVYIGGYPVKFTQSENEFFGYYPVQQSQAQIATGNGVLTNFTGNLNNFTGIPVLRNNVVFSAQDINTNGVQVHDDPATAANNVANLVGDVGGGPNNINYVTGAFNVSFDTAPANNEPVWAFSIPYEPARPNMMLYFNNEFTLRPVPDVPYQVRLEVDIRPAALLAAGQTPELEQWWQYIAYGASKKIFEDRQDMESVAAIMPEYKEQETLVQRRTIVQQTTQRVGTIYSYGAGIDPYYGNDGNYFF